MSELAIKYEERRQHRRYDLNESAILHAQRIKREVLIDNISVKGMKIITPENTIPLEMQLKINQDIAIELLTGEKLFGLVVWSIRNTAGVFFNQSISEEHDLMIKAKALKEE